MEALDLARWQFAITTIYHFLFVPLTLGLSVLVAVMESFHFRTKLPVYRDMAIFWGRLFVINFALGVATGIVQEFQFGMNWSAYSRFVGDIFGVPLAIEALLAFFMESTFLGVWLFGRGKIHPTLHLASIWLVAIGSNLSAVWILVANSWMQEPIGYVLRNGRAELTDFFAVVLSPHVQVQVPHVILGGMVTGSLFVLGISAWHLQRRNKVDHFGRSIKIALVALGISSIAVATTGHGQAQHVAKTQPMKMAAFEALWETEAPAGFSIFSAINQNAGNSTRELRVPFLLSVLAFNNTTSEVKGINDLQKEMEAQYGPGDYVPPVALTYWSFRVMVGLGGLFILIALWGFVRWWRDRLEQPGLFLRVGVVALFLPYVANSAGWIVTELGRQPWIVYGLQLTADAVSPNVTANMVLFSMIGFTVLYAFLAVVDFYLLSKYALERTSPERDAAVSGAHAY
ncbi:MAG TPA: cytochrome ubiquinol oxidase subunit I [Deinococcales bacterium]|nr:cytochrome ubiquinol oxidase subunit I [Deinococcales bacterium]